MSDLNQEGLFVDDRHAFTTVSGRKVNVLNLTPGDICIEDIAVALGNICRYGGHVQSFLSVAEHSVEVSKILGLRNPELSRAGLLHDAHEAYIGDIIKPLKVHPNYAFFDGWARHVDWCIGVAFGIDPALFHCREVRDADMLSFLYEKDERMGRYPPDEATSAFLTRWECLA